VSGRKVLLGLSTALFIALVVTGFMAVGSPSTARRVDADRQRIERLNSLHYELQAFYNRSGDLPQSVEELRSQNRYDMGYDPTRDPGTEIVFEYEVIGDRTYRVCAVFDSDSDEDRSGYDTGFPGNNDHPKGRHCFEREVVKEDVPPEPGVKTRTQP